MNNQETIDNKKKKYTIKTNSNICKDNLYTFENSKQIYSKKLRAHSNLTTSVSSTKIILIAEDLSNKNSCTKQVIKINDTPIKKKEIEKSIGDTEKNYWKSGSQDIQGIKEKNNYSVNDYGTEMTRKNSSVNHVEKVNLLQSQGKNLLDYSENKNYMNGNLGQGDSQILEPSCVFDDIGGNFRRHMPDNLETDCQMYFGPRSGKNDNIQYFDGNMEDSQINRDPLYLGFENIDADLSLDFPNLPFSEKSNYKMAGGVGDRDFMDLDGFLGGGDDEPRRGSSHSLIGGY